jgi:peptidoglycan/LPS O-acetylase OafA/YrhL
VAFCWLVSGAARGFDKPRSVLEVGPIVFLGRISYGLYLYHAFVPNLAKAVFRAAGVELTSWDVPRPLFDFAATFAGPMAAKVTAVFMIVLYTAVTIAIASVSWFFWERPLNGLRKHFRYKAVPAESPA